ncbi:hypothetical protein B1C78_15670 [Thioalkalivibrio denitrificans]|uniref:Uncharacterized protein n=1 Tax=Thioalkalivibrio denitrificans TaxID=108003 RepID=A0A1V3NAH2_9GAMM|nr:hypothetical protein B1C78_15670 [Thioalkalivibrio denitrificans]
MMLTGLDRIGSAGTRSWLWTVRVVVSRSMGGPHPGPPPQAGEGMARGWVLGFSPRPQGEGRVRVASVTAAQSNPVMLWQADNQAPRIHLLLLTS